MGACRQVAIAVAVVVGMAGPARAEPKLSLSGGLANNLDFDGAKSVGVNAGVGVRLVGRLSAVGEVRSVKGSNWYESWTDSSIGVGVRASPNRQTGVVPFAQFLVGSWISRATRSNRTLLMMEASGGVDIMFNRHYGLRLRGGAERAGRVVMVHSTIGAVVNLGR